MTNTGRVFGRFFYAISSPHIGRFLGRFWPILSAIVAWKRGVFSAERGRFRPVLGGVYMGWNGRESAAETRRMEKTGGPQNIVERVLETRRMVAGQGVK